jgi:AraC-like DNA-binding protein
MTMAPYPLDDLVDGLASDGCRSEGHLAGYTRVDRDWAFHDRVLAEQLVYLPVLGACTWRCGDRELVLRTGDLLWMPPGLRYSTWPADPAIGLGLYHFRFRAWRGRRELLPTAPVIQRGCGDLRGLCDRWVRDQRRRDADADARVGAFVLLLASEVRSRSVAGDAPGRLAVDQRRRLEDHVRDHPRRRFDSADLADLLGLGRVHFTRLFKCSYGMPPRTWLKEQRLEAARVLLRTSTLKVGAVAERLGWNSAQLFSRQYRARFGVSPGRDR